MAYQKGIGLELKIAELFKKNGYTVTHNVKMQGKSGAEHQIDVYAEYKAPLHTTKLIVEAKSYQSNIDKEIVMKLIQIQQDLSVDRAILVTTSEFTPGTIQTASQYHNLELWDRSKIASLLGEVQLLDTSDGLDKVTTASSKAIEATLSLDDMKKYATESIEKKAKGGFLGKGKIVETLVGIRKLFYPYYDAEIDATVKAVEKTGLFSKDTVTKTVRSRISVDAITGSLVDTDEHGISYRYSFLSRLDNDEINLLYLVSHWKTFGIESVYQLGLSDGKSRKLVKGLVGRGLLTQLNTRPVTYGLSVSYPTNPTNLVSIITKYTPRDISVQDKKIDAVVQPASVITAFAHYWVSCKVLSVDSIHYPYYVVEYQRGDHSRRTEVIDGMTGERNEYLESIIK